MDKLILQLLSLHVFGLVQFLSSSECPSSICTCRSLEIASRLETEVRCNDENEKGYIPVFRPFTESISSLYLSGIELTVLGNQSFRQLSSIRELYLNDNYLTRIEARAFAVVDHSIELLDLTHNKLRDLYFLTTHDFSSLRELLLRDNQLATISPGTFALVPALENLNLDNNQLSGQLPFLRQPSLRGLLDLNLDANQLTDIYPSDFYYLSNLRSLLVNRNQLRTIDFLRHPIFKQLQGFSVADNQLVQVNETHFADKHLLKWLDLSSNSLTNASFLSSCSLRRLEEIYLSFNQLTELPPDSFQATTSLTIFVVDNNQLKTLPTCALLPFYKTMQMFDISNNPIECDCELSWLQQPHTITTERQSLCVNIELTSTADYDTSRCDSTSTCIEADNCPTGMAANPLYGSITDQLHNEHPSTDNSITSAATVHELNTLTILTFTFLFLTR